MQQISPCISCCSLRLHARPALNPYDDKCTACLLQHDFVYFILSSKGQNITSAMMHKDRQSWFVRVMYCVMLCGGCSTAVNRQSLGTAPYALGTLAAVGLIKLLVDWFLRQVFMQLLGAALGIGLPVYCYTCGFILISWHPLVHVQCLLSRHRFIM